MTVIDMFSHRSANKAPSAHHAPADGFEPEAVANALIDMAEQDGIRLTHLRLQKLLYMAHAWHLMAYGRRLINEQPRVWPLGCVIETVHVVVSQMRQNVLRAGVMLPSRFDAHAPAPRLPLRHPDVRVREGVEEALIAIKSVWDGCRDLTDKQMSTTLHREGSAWARAEAAHMATIPDAFMIEEARSWIRKDQSCSQ